MTEPGPAQPATPDELAALYLRARDVPCPGCGYNRRDGAVAICPECSKLFELRIESTEIRQRIRRRDTWTAVLLSAIGTTMLVQSASGVTLAGINIYTNGYMSYFGRFLAFGAIRLVCSALVIRCSIAWLLKERRGSHQSELAPLPSPMLAAFVFVGIAPEYTTDGITWLIGLVSMLF